MYAFDFSVECFGEIWYIDIRKGKYPLQSGCSQGNLDVLTDTAYPVGRQDRHFYFRLFLLLRKASNAITRLPKAHNNVNMPMKIERISKAVICATVFALLRSVLNGCPLDIQHPFLLYSGKPVIRCWEATSSLRYGRRQTSVPRTLNALSWVLSYGLRHATNISFFPP